jgi:organic hydroperoxide reductase OsmC/OhrA
MIPKSECRPATAKNSVNMSAHKAIIRWKGAGPDFLTGKYSREHTWTFDGGLTVPASPSPAIVAAPYSNAANVDPEEAFVAAVSSCHMLFYLMFAYQHGFQVDSYEDEAVGTMSKNERGILWISAIRLNPHIAYGGEKLPSPADEEHLHHLSHEQCFIANSIKTQVSVEPKH